jgi:anti-sigma factor RsiW
MRCGKVQKLISARLDGRLDAARDEAVRRHIAECAQCRAFAADLATIPEALDSLSAPEPRWGFTGRLMARLPERQSGAGFARSWLDLLRPAPVGLGAAAFGLGVALVVLASDSLNVPEPGTENGVAVLAADYFDTLSEDALEERLLDLLPETEN